jgi:hypothetical protein
MKYLQKQIFHRTIVLKPIIIILLLALFSGAAYGGWMIFKKKVYGSPLTMKRLIHEAEIILVGKVISKKSEDRSDSFPVTYVTILPEYYIKGDVFVPQIVVKVRGGETKGGRIMLFGSEWINFEEDEEVLLFLNRWKNEEYYHVVADSTGKYPIQTDGTTGEKVVLNPDFPFNEALLFKGKQAPLAEITAQIKKVMRETDRWESIF